MLSPIHFCSYCADEYDPIEGERPSIEEPSFCSDSCEESWTAAEDASGAYEASRYPAPVFGP